MERQMEIPLPNNPSIYEKHLCADLMKKNSENLGNKKIKVQPPRLVQMFRSLDARWLVGECSRCKTQIVRKA